jgi:hypothetical protein
MFKQITLLLALVCSLFPSPATGQFTPVNSPSTRLLHRVGIKHVGFIGDAILNNRSVDAEGRYMEKHSDDFPKVETRYDQDQVDRGKKSLVAFWKGHGIDVEVSSELAPAPGKARYADLTFFVRKLPSFQELP